MRATFFVFLALSLPVAALAQEAPLTLNEAIAVALRRQPSLAGSAANREAALERLKQSRSRLGPSVTPTFSYQSQASHGSTTTFVNGAPVTKTGTTTSDNRQEQISTSLRLFDTGNRKLTVRQSQQALTAQELSEQNTRQTVINNVAANYYAVLRTRALVKVSMAQVDRAENALKLVQAQLIAKQVARKDTLQADADLQNARVNLLQARNNVQIAEAQLRSSMGALDLRELNLADVVAPTAQTPITIASVIGDETDDARVIAKLSAFANKSRPDVEQGRVGVASSETGIQLAKVGARPTVTADVSDQHAFDAKNNPLKHLSDNQLFSLNFSVPLYDGGNVRAAVRASEATKRASEAQLEVQVQQVSVEVEQTWRSLQLARLSIPAAESAQKAAQINYDAAIAARREGIGNITDVITAQTSLVQAQTNYVQAIYNFYTADAQLAKAVGLAEKLGEGIKP